MRDDLDISAFGTRQPSSILARVLQQPPELVADGLPFVDAGGRLNVQDIHDQVAFWQTNGQASRDVDARAIVDLSFVDGHFNVPR